MLQKHLLILRASPDWMNFDIETTRLFLRSFALPENLIIEFAALWDRYFKGDYRSLRAQLKTLALQTYNEVRHGCLIRHQEWDGTAAQGSWVAFLDDDDWLSPELFDVLPGPRPDQDGMKWGSLRLGRKFAPDGYAQPIVQARPLDRIVYTNNYAVTANALRKSGRRALFEHDAAQRTFDQSDFTLAT